MISTVTSPDQSKVMGVMGQAQHSSGNANADMSCKMKVGLSTGAPAGYLDPYPQVFSEKNSYLDL